MSYMYDLEKLFVKDEALDNIIINMINSIILYILYVDYEKSE